MKMICAERIFSEKLIKNNEMNLCALSYFFTNLLSRWINSIQSDVYGLEIKIGALFDLFISF